MSEKHKMLNYFLHLHFNSKLKLYSFRNYFKGVLRKPFENFCRFKNKSFILANIAFQIFKIIVP